MPPPTNPICLHQRSYACEVCGKCDHCCSCRAESGGAYPGLQHVDSKTIADRWRVLRIMAMDHEARRG